MPKQQPHRDIEPDGRQFPLLTDLGSDYANIAALQQQLAEKSATTRSLDRQVDTLAAKAAAATKRIAELDSELAWAREELAQRDNENNSLQKSVDLVTAENDRLSKRLADSETEVGKAYVLLERMKAALVVTERERAKTATAIDHANQKRRQETSGLTARLEAAASCAATAGELLAGMRRNLCEKLELLQKLLEVKDRQLNELKQSRSKLIERTSKLLEAFKARDSVLAAAEEENKSLTARLARAEASLAKSENDLKGLGSELQAESKRRRTAEARYEQALTDLAELRTEPDYSAAHSGVPIPPAPLPTDMLLAETVSF